MKMKLATVELKDNYTLNKRSPSHFPGPKCYNSGNLSFISRFHCTGRLRVFHFNNHAPSLTLAGPPSYWHPLSLPLRSPLRSLPDQHPADEDRVPRVPGAGGDCTALTGHQVPDRPRGLHTGQVTAQEGIGQ